MAQGYVKITIGAGGSNDAPVDTRPAQSLRCEQPDETPDGQMHVAMMKADRPRLSVDMLSLDPNVTGEPVERHMQLAGKRLSLTMPPFPLFGEPHTGHLVWERV